MLQLRNVGVVLFAVGLALAAGAVRAWASEDGIEREPPGVGPRELWVGADAGAHNWLVYSGTTFAPFGDIHADGWRLRATTGYGQYSYNWDASTRVKVDKTYADAMVGYQHRFGELTAKAFVGWALLANAYDIESRSRSVAKSTDGIKGALELWLNLGASAWSSLDLSYADTRDTWSVRSRTGYRVLPTVSLGVEGVFNHADLAGEVQTSAKLSVEGNSRIGAFARYEWFGGEISMSAGYSGDWIERDGPNGGTDVLNKPQVYGTANVIVQF